MHAHIHAIVDRQMTITNKHSVETLDLYTQPSIMIIMI
jgi:hypothetical protein